MCQPIDQEGGFMQLRHLTHSAVALAAFLTARIALGEPMPVLTHGIVARSVIPPAASISGGPSFGVADLTYIRVNGLDFFPYDSGSGYAGAGNARWATVAGYAMEAPLHIPSGAVIDHLELDTCDVNVSSDASLQLFECDPFGSGCAQIGIVLSSGSTGCTAYTLSGFQHTVDNAAHSLDLQAIAGAADGSISIATAVVGYRLQVSPAPAVATFPNDVPTNHPFFQHVEALASAGITAGVGPGTYGVDQPVTRGQMAVFLSLALGLHFPN
jgi:hypothetical protein